MVCFESEIHCHGRGEVRPKAVDVSQVHLITIGGGELRRWVERDAAISTGEGVGVAANFLSQGWIGVGVTGSRLARSGADN